MTPLIVLGCGYVGSRIARAALAEGRTVRVCARSTGKLAPLGALGAEVKYLDASTPKQLPVALASLQGATVVYSIPPVTNLPPGQVLRAALQAAYGAGCACFIYFSSSGLYGAGPDDDVWIDEDTPIVHDDPSMKYVSSDEDALRACTFDRLRLVTLRLAPVYGPGRGVRNRLHKGDYKLLDDGQHAISRIYVDDVVRIVAAAEARAATKSVYLVADDEPTTQRAYATWLCDRLGLPLPGSRSMFEPGSPRAHRNRKIRNAKLKRELELELKFPTFRDGEAAIDAELASPQV
ncbi:MAG: NAD-dependent epimerase/dehydratase family protein [Kofleriaceae bacterium]